MLSTILAILSNSSIGSIIGWVGGLLNRKIDLEAKKFDHQHELLLRDKDLEQTKVELEGKIAVEDRQIEQTAYGAMAEGFKEQATLIGGKYSWTDAVSKLIRPVTTILFLFFSFFISVYILYTAFNAGISFSPEDWKLWATKILEWIFFQSGVVIGWWFANRPSGRAQGGK